jgi:hypothetical protein
MPACAGLVARQIFVERRARHNSPLQALQRVHLDCNASSSATLCRSACQFIRG